MLSLSHPETPLERCLNLGAHTLSLRECLSLILETRFPGPHPLRLGALAPASASSDAEPSTEPVLLTESEAEHALFHGLEIGQHGQLPGLLGLRAEEKARILSALEIGRRFALHRERMRTIPRRPSGRAALKPYGSRALEKIPLSWRQEPREWLGFVPIFRNGLVGEFGVTELGQRTHVNTDPAELFARILAFRPRGFYLFHNHPSGNLSISDADAELTRRVGSLGQRLNTPLLGHAIVTLREHQWIDDPRRGMPLG
jgi:DNA repair protein RadC